MGRPKLVLPLRNRPIIDWTLDALSVEGVDRIVLVIHPADDVLRRVIAHRVIAHRSEVEVAINPSPELGMLSSIVIGIDAALSRGSSHLLVCPGDLPGLRPETVTAVIEHHRTSSAMLVVPTFQERRGHPLLIDSSLVPTVQSLDRQIGLRQITHNPKHPVLEVQVDDAGCLRDIDTPSDYRTFDQESSLSDD
jgi:molybdenum cofactor cytidylyltransferase